MSRCCRERAGGRAVCYRRSRSCSVAQATRRLPTSGDACSFPSVNTGTPVFQLYHVEMNHTSPSGEASTGQERDRTSPRWTSGPRGSVSGPFSPEVSTPGFLHGSSPSGTHPDHFLLRLLSRVSSFLPRRPNHPGSSHTLFHGTQDRP